ncbi:Fe-S protein assembly co-chaperone HscB [Neisseria sp. ZJ106]|uniref:Co-chaperone protein HscB homolog n=1 Tax=Neisseria lisongii TaxID=2912188 RepID=A0AAW5ARD1_9NEIS|nr:Fe-S protein assembly co-chaperone HscB [Neisseria lisongii]MCF7522031.1 Fe-S protein assembly co-chaperone HscB [Neisseria lisongii]MCF7528682.1 Fe-S protein assembly co-chaperone HscB [Neisseria lisongii]MCF7529540.1 Fe-S protein assembly co-chaperone HscB [Neisseria lisongii]WCL72163.1 Fe-S protein assembly co-chaperone HscB [Neisseria lisongii]
MSQYFTLFQIEPVFDLDEARLEQAYRDFSARFHPDKFASASSFEQKQAVMMSATINEAYRVLKNPIDRAAHLLQMQGIDADAPEHTQFSTEFLTQQMEWREALMEAQFEQDQAALNRLQQEISGEQASLYQALSQALRQHDWQQAAQLVRQGRFLNKIGSELAAAL